MRPFVTVVVTLLALAAFFLGIGWGLPSRNADPFLFGDHPAWSGDQISRLLPAGPQDASRAADVSERPIDRRDGPVVVNATDEDRARIVRRYRLMSYQPDEFTTFAALARMRPSKGDLDPRMYKYGGLWIYPIGALLKIASVLKVIDLRPEMSWYLDHPEAFGRFYVVARVYSGCWGLAGLWAVSALVRRVTGDACAATVGAVCFAVMPLVVNAAHEAKPHLAGAVLMLLAVLAAARFVERRGSWLATALLCGAAIGMVPSAVPIILVIPLMFVLRQSSSLQSDSPSPRADESGAALRSARGLRGLALRALLAGAVAGCVFVATNPFVVINLVCNQAVLRSNTANSAAFYTPGLSGAGLFNAMLLIGEGASFLLAAVGIVGAIALGVRVVRMRRSATQDEVRRRATGLLLAAPALLVAAIFVLLAANQPADYARFALPFDLFLLVEAVVAVATFVPRGWGRRVSYGLLVASTLFMGHVYVHHFLRDTTPDTTRMEAAVEIRRLLASGDSVLVTPIEPAPWSMPPVDLFRWKIVLDQQVSNRNAPVGGPDFDELSRVAVQRVNGKAVSVRPVDVLPGPGSPAVKLFRSCPISWASKPFEIVAPAQPQPGHDYGESDRGRR
jgi:hypothetical protein